MQLFSLSLWFVLKLRLFLLISVSERVTSFV